MKLKNIKKIKKVVQVLSSKNTTKVVAAIRSTKNASQSHIIGETGLAQPTISNTIALLRKQFPGIIKIRQSGRNSTYTINEIVFGKIEQAAAMFSNLQDELRNLSELADTVEPEVTPMPDAGDEIAYEGSEPVYEDLMEPEEIQ